MMASVWSSETSAKFTRISGVVYSKKILCIVTEVRISNSTSQCYNLHLIQHVFQQLPRTKLRLSCIRCLLHPGHMKSRRRYEHLTHLNLLGELYKLRLQSHSLYKIWNYYLPPQLLHSDVFPRTFFSTTCNFRYSLRLEPHWPVTIRQDCSNKTRRSVLAAGCVHTEQRRPKSHSVSRQ
jgi:hypothetical protein